MKFSFFLFLLLIPSVSALAVTPTSIDLRDGSEAQLYVYNTLEKEMDFRITGIYSENFTLGPLEEKRIVFSYFGKNPGSFKSSILVQEIYTSELTNGIEIPVTYSGKIPEREAFTIPWFSMLSSLVIIILFIVLYLWNKKKRPKKSLQKI